MGAAGEAEGVGMARGIRRTLALDRAPRAELERARDRDGRPYVRERAAALLKVAGGARARAVALRGRPRSRDPDTLYAWLDSYARAGPDGRAQRPRRARGLPPSGAEALAAAVRQRRAASGLARPRWRRQDLRAALPCLAGYALPGICRALTRLGVSRQQGRPRRASPDPAYRPKRAWLERARALALRPAGRTVLLYGDECSLPRAPAPAPAYAPRGATPAVAAGPRDRARGRVAGAVDRASGRLAWAARATMGGAGRRRFLVKLRQTSPAQRLALVGDNWPVHQHRAVLATAAALTSHLLWPPTSAPWTSPAAKVWRQRRQDESHPHRLADDWAALKARAAAWLDDRDRSAPDLLRAIGLHHPPAPHGDDPWPLTEVSG